MGKFREEVVENRDLGVFRCKEEEREAGVKEGLGRTCVDGCGKNTEGGLEDLESKEGLEGLEERNEENEGLEDINICAGTLKLAKQGIVVTEEFYRYFFLPEKVEYGYLNAFSRRFGETLTPLPFREKDKEYVEVLQIIFVEIKDAYTQSLGKLEEKIKLLDKKMKSYEGIERKLPPVSYQKTVEREVKKVEKSWLLASIESYIDCILQKLKKREKESGETEEKLGEPRDAVEVESRIIAVFWEELGEKGNWENLEREISFFLKVCVQKYQNREYHIEKVFDALFQWKPCDQFYTNLPLNNYYTYW